LVEAESLEKRAAQHAAMQAAADAAFGERNRGGGAAAAAAPGAALPLAPGTGIYSAVGLSYGGTEAQGAGGGAGIAGDGFGGFISSDSDSDESETDGDEEEDENAGPVTEADVAQEAEDERVDSIADEYGLKDFCYRLHKMQEREGEQEAMARKRPR
jgi:arginine/serine-rich splicing factor 16